jgi:hypothetical protein
MYNLECEGNSPQKEDLVSVLNEKQIKIAAIAESKKELKIKCKQLITL